RMESRIKVLTRKAIKGDIAEAMGKEIIVNGIGLTYMEYENEDKNYIQEFAKEYLGSRPNTVLLVINRVNNGTEYMVYLGSEAAKHVNAKDLIAKLNPGVNGRGGGSVTYGQGFTQGRPSIDTFVSIIKSLL
ncbi:MAG: DHHA1 domain-containing protein, partial [Vulcanisaeta sp.]|uniref:DHHA1 domain-containing protein n=1 Tax=Vulcanisaeta sp. TaxID=2020871 RepID=UPI003D0EB575